MQWIGLTQSILPVILAGIFGTCIAHYYKSLEDRNTQFAIMRTEATNNYYNLINLLGQRHFFALQAAAGFNWNLNDANDRMARYEQSIIDWNKNRYGTIASGKRYFGDGIQDEIIALIKKFDNIHKQLFEAKKLYDAKQLYINGQPTMNLNSTLQDIYQLDDDISTFSDKLQGQLKVGKIDAYAPNSPKK